MAPLGVTFNLMIKPEYAGWSAATQIAASINDTYFNSPTTVGTPIAVATDDRTVRITETPPDRAAPAPPSAQAPGPIPAPPTLARSAQPHSTSNRPHANRDARSPQAIPSLSRKTPPRRADLPRGA